MSDKATESIVRDHYAAQRELPYEVIRRVGAGVYIPSVAH